MHNNIFILTGSILNSDVDAGKFWHNVHVENTNRTRSTDDVVLWKHNNKRATTAKASTIIISSFNGTLEIFSVKKKLK